MDTNKQEQIIEEQIKENNIDAAVKSLYELIVFYAKNKNFQKAEELREKLIDINSLALTEIITSAEIIEAEKTASIDKKHQEIWKDLYELLTTEEANALYQSLEKIDMDPNQTIIAQGKNNDKLFFIDSGQINITFTSKDKIEFVKEVGQGETVGQDTFFPISLCTSSATTSSGVQLKHLTRSKFDIIAANHPGFDDKLESFCRKRQGETIEDILKQREVERRKFERFKIKGTVKTQLLQNDGKPISSPFAGNIEDVSMGGLSFFIKCSQKSTARLLLGRPALIMLSLKNGDEGKAYKFTCQIACAKHHMFTDYSIHVRFGTPLTEKQLAELRGIS